MAVSPGGPGHPVTVDAARLELLADVRPERVAADGRAGLDGVAEPREDLQRVADRTRDQQLDLGRADPDVQRVAFERRRRRG